MGRRGIRSSAIFFYCILHLKDGSRIAFSQAITNLLGLEKDIRGHLRRLHGRSGISSRTAMPNNGSKQSHLRIPRSYHALHRSTNIMSMGLLPLGGTSGPHSPPDCVHKGPPRAAPPPSPLWEANFPLEGWRAMSIALLTITQVIDSI